jgi:hypothetical protein
VAVGGLIGWVQFCSKINASQARMPAIPVTPVAAPAFAASSCEIGGKLMIGPPGGGVYIGAGAAGGSGVSIAGNCGGALGTVDAGGSGVAFSGGKPPIGICSHSAFGLLCGL